MIKLWETGLEHCIQIWRKTATWNPTSLGFRTQLSYEAGGLGVKFVANEWLTLDEWDYLVASSPSLVTD